MLVQVVVDGHHWVENLPSIILAAVMVDGEKDTAASKHAWSFTRKARSDFVETFGLSPMSVPLVLYDPSATSAHFRLVD